MHDPLMRRFTQHVWQPLDVDLMQCALMLSPLQGIGSACYVLLLDVANALRNERSATEGLGSCRRAAALFEGEHDFTQFATLAPGAARDPVKRVAHCAVVPEGGGALRMEVVGDAFLWKMVRHMVRTHPNPHRVLLRGGALRAEWVGDAFLWMMVRATLSLIGCCCLH